MKTTSSLRTHLVAVLPLGAALMGSAVACSNATSEHGQVTAEAPPVAPSSVVDTATSPAKDARSHEFNPRLLRRFAPLREYIGDRVQESDAKIALGRMLYFDRRLSKDKDLSCNSCHKLSEYGVDGQATSPGTKGQHGGRNSPTVYNAAGYFTQFWDGRAANVEEQAKGPILNPIEMAMPDGAAVVQRLKAIPAYSPAFAAAFPGESDPVTYDNLGRAIGAFERGLTTPSRWDRYLKGDKAALSSDEVEGLRIFTNVGCMVCHTGEFLGGSSYQRAGAVEPWPNQADTGRHKVTKAEGDRMMFKVPTLRNIARTAPYFHDGSATTLDEAVRMMGRHQLGLELDKSEIASIVTWLNSLTGELPAQYVAEPQLPPDAIAMK